MMRPARWALPALVVAVPVGILLPALGQRADEQQSDDVKDAREIIALIEQGQLSLPDATKLAEKHAKGKALRASCEVRPAEAMPFDPERPGGPLSEEDKPTMKHLLYDVTCFATEDQKIQVLQVDGLTGKVMERRHATSQQQ